MKVRAALVARLAVYAAALLVIATARLPEPRIKSSAGAARASAPAASTAPVRLGLAAILLTGIVLEVMRRRSVWR